MQFHLITLFPQMFSALNYGVINRAITKKLITLKFYNPREFSTDKYRRVDDRPYGGGPGMVMQIEPLCKAILAAKKACTAATKVIHLTPQGQLLNQNKIKSLSNQQQLILIAGRYEGIDERIIETCVDEEISVGDYVLSGGELPAMTIIDAVTRLLPEVLGHADSAQQDSFMNNLLDHPHYTRPELFNGQKVPNVLLSGNHKQIARWQIKQVLGRTYLRRPDLLNKCQLTDCEKELLKEFINEQNKE